MAIMSPARLCLLGLALCPIVVWAAGPAPAAASPTATAASAASASASAPRVDAGDAGQPRDPVEPNVRHIVIEGENTRVEELRVRGQTQSVVVRNKSAPSYEIVIGDKSRDLSSDGGAQKGAAGQRVWRVLTF